MLTEKDEMLLLKKAAKSFKVGGMYFNNAFLTIVVNEKWYDITPGSTFMLLENKENYENNILYMKFMLFTPHKYPKEIKQNIYANEIMEFKISESQECSPPFFPVIIANLEECFTEKGEHARMEAVKEYEQRSINKNNAQVRNNNPFLTIKPQKTIHVMPIMKEDGSVLRSRELCFE